jgi:hypothetical protein
LGDVTAKSWGMMLHYCLFKRCFIREIGGGIFSGLLIGLMFLPQLSMGVEERGIRVKKGVD